MRRDTKARNAKEELKKLVPALGDWEFSSFATLKSRADRLCGFLRNHVAKAGEVDNAYVRAEKIKNSQTLVNQVIASYSRLKANALDVLRLRKGAYAQALSDKQKSVLQNLKKNSSKAYFGLRQQSECEGEFHQFLKLAPAWSCTLLSLRNASPCIAGVFDRVIIDEAAQCDIPSVVPALFRAKGVTVIGDEAQFPPVIDLRESLHEHLLRKHGLAKMEFARFSFTENTAYGIVCQKPVWLREHFRCAEEIVDYFGNEFYGGMLKARTNKNTLIAPQSMGFRSAYVWRDIKNSRDGEIQTVVSLMDDLVKNNYTGTIGIISPLRKICEMLQTRLYGYSKKLPQFDLQKHVNTANGFQGGECDLIIFVLGLNDYLTLGEKWYITAAENRYIYNVAASRARACLVIVGDRERAASAQEPWIRHLVKPIRRQCAGQTDVRSPGEQILKEALERIGLSPQPQYPLVGRWLDLALVEEKIDIEIDGVAYHLNKYGERKADDFWRDMQVSSAGWRIMRFWHREVVTDADACAQKVFEAIRNPG